jgi:hypothetical protein
MPGITERTMLASSDGATLRANLPQDPVDLIARVLPLQHARVVPFNPVIVSVEPCDMACVPTGTATGAKSCTYYQAKYSSKDSNPIAATASVLQTAQQHIEACPSVAEDAQTNPLRKPCICCSGRSTVYTARWRSAISRTCCQCSHKMWIVYESKILHAEPMPHLLFFSCPHF